MKIIPYNKLSYNCELSRTAHAKNTIAMIERNERFFQRELGIRAEVPRFSCRSIQKMNMGIKSNAAARRMMLYTFLILEISSVRILNKKERVSETYSTCQYRITYAQI